MSNYIKTDIAGKINNLKHFKSEALFPVFEAVTNSIQAIEERGIPLNEGLITIKVHREKILIDGGEELPISGFEIEDNGIGFNTKNYESFLTSDSTYKMEKGCKGIGRFFWLKAFNEVKIQSVYSENSETRKRVIDFNLRNGITQKSDTQSKEQLKTIVHLIGFKDEYRKQPSAYKTSSKMAQRVLEHCLSYFICDKVPNIVFHDDATKINLNELFSDIKEFITPEAIEIKNQKFILYHMKLYSTTHRMNHVVFCAHYRDVLTENISKYLGVNNQFDEDNKKFAYAVYVTGDYLDQHIDSSRLDFSIPEEDSVLYDTYPVSMSELKKRIIASSKSFLKEYLQVILDSKKGIVEKYIAEKNPTLRAVSTYCPEIYDEIELNSSDEKIDEVLCKHKGKAEYQIRQQSEKLLKTQIKSVDDIKKKYKDYEQKLEAFQKDQLANYILYRKMIIDLLDKKLELNASGKYSNEDIVHDIYFPRKSKTDLIDYSEHNLWLIDENLTFHTFAASDLELNKISSSTSTERPDIIIFSEADEETRTARSCSIVEFKKPQRKNFDQDPTAQMFGYVRKIRNEEVFLSNGRPLRVDDKTRFYLYAICDINDKIKTFAEDNGNYSELKGELGFYTYNPKLNAHVEILAFDKIIIDAKRRHKIFFNKLGIG